MRSIQTAPILKQMVKTDAKLFFKKAIYEQIAVSNFSAWRRKLSLKVTRFLSYTSQKKSFPMSAQGGAVLLCIQIMAAVKKFP